MVTETAENGLRHARAPLIPWPTPVGLAVAVMVPLALMLSGQRQVAVGFLIPLFGFMAVDFGLSAVALRERRVRVRPVRTLIRFPDPFLISVTAEPGQFPVQVRIPPIGMGQLHADVVLARDVESDEVELHCEHSRAAKHLRYRSSTSVLGLVWARRWETQETPYVYAAPSPSEASTDVLPQSTELTRLREYVPGDRISRVSWPTTARTGRLHVRAEELIDDEIVVVVDLGQQLTYVAGDFEADRVMSRATAVIDQLLEAGRLVRLITWQVRLDLYEEECASALTRPWRKGKAADMGQDSSTGWFQLNGAPAMVVSSTIVTESTDVIRELALADVAPEPPPATTPHLRIDPAGVHLVQ